MTREEILKEAEKHFFAAMLVGWAAGGEISYFSRLPEHRGIVYEKDDFCVMDCYGVGKLEKSAGTTRIWYRNEFIWFMSYGGFYQKEVIPFLKGALMVNYSRRIFLGGRGPKHSPQHDCKVGFPTSYFNDVEKSSFEYFKGQEYIMIGGETVGRHDYFGMALI